MVIFPAVEKRNILLFFTVPCFPSCRATLCLVGFCGGLIFFLMRSNISVAVVCMTTPEYVVVSEWPGVIWNGWFNLTEEETCMKKSTKRGYSELQGLHRIYQKKKCAESESKSKSNPPYGRVSTILKHLIKLSDVIIRCFYHLHGPTCYNCKRFIHINRTILFTRDPIC